MSRLYAILAAGGAVVALGATVVSAGDEAELPLHDKPQASVQKLVRHETLELPGLTACHQCEWRPHPHEQAAPEQCGLTADGAPRTAQFECGFSPDCERVCNFVSCTP
ncbi:MAG TPA: hypothetical protein VFR39_08010 [Burkholderiales bacterium]|nr:hypothetical protein [Burkholderiales bacterium]